MVVKKSMVFIIGMLIVFNILSNNIELELEKKIKLKATKDIVLLSLSNFTMGKNGEFIFPDGRASNIKVFDANGKFMYLLGRKGHGPGEFITPYACYGNGKSIWISDIRALKISQYDYTNNRYKYKRDCLRLSSLCTDLFVKNNIVYIAGYVQGEKQTNYYMYSKKCNVEAKFNVSKYLIKSKLKYGVDTPSKTDHYSSYDMSGYFDILDDNIYFVWGADLRIIKFNLKNNSVNIFGKKTKNYIKPFVSKELKIAYKQRDSLKVANTKKNVCFVGGIFVTDNLVGLVYRGIYQEKINGYPVFVQFYSTEGKYLNEIRLKEAVGNLFNKSFYYSPNKKKLYYLNIIENDDDDDYEILVYKLK